MIVVTGGAGFIGSNLVKGLNTIGHNDILIVDDLTDGTKFKNIVDCKILDYQDKETFLAHLKNAAAFREKIVAVFHLGACSTTTEWDGAYMMRNNYEYSKKLLHFCIQERIPFIYASSAAIYGNSKNFKEQPKNEKPLNIYGYSKLLFDQYVRQFLPQLKSQVVGLRYFNVYGPREQHKGEMASVIWHANKQMLQDKIIRLFSGCDGYSDGEQLRDFVFVADTVNVNLWFWQQQGKSGIYNIGTGRAESFNTMARAILAYYGYGEIAYIPFPEKLLGHYQSFTQADLSALREVGCDITFRDVTTGVKDYLVSG